MPTLSKSMKQPNDCLELNRLRTAALELESQVQRAVRARAPGFEGVRSGKRRAIK